MEQLVPIGFVRRAHGIRGEVRISIEPRYADTVPRLEELAVGEQPDGAVTGRIEWARPHQGEFLVKLTSVIDRTVAERLSGQKVYSYPTALEAAGWDGVPPEWIEGYQVVDEAGTSIGVLDRTETYPGSDMLIIRTAGDREILVPAVPEIVIDIDGEEERITLRPPKGLLDLGQP